MSVMLYTQHDSNRTDTGQTRRLTRAESGKTKEAWLLVGLFGLDLVEQSLVYKFALLHRPSHPSSAPSQTQTRSQVIHFHYGQHSCQLPHDEQLPLT